MLQPLFCHACAFFQPCLCHDSRNCSAQLDRALLEQVKLHARTKHKGVMCTRNFPMLHAFTLHVESWEQVIDCLFPRLQSGPCCALCTIYRCFVAAQIRLSWCNSCSRQSARAKLHMVNLSSSPWPIAEPQSEFGDDGDVVIWKCGDASYTD